MLLKRFSWHFECPIFRFHLIEIEPVPCCNWPIILTRTFIQELFSLATPFLWISLSCDSSNIQRIFPTTGQQRGIYNRECRILGRVKIDKRLDSVHSLSWNINTFRRFHIRCHRCRDKTRQHFPTKSANFISMSLFNVFDFFQEGLLTTKDKFQRTSKATDQYNDGGRCVCKGAFVHFLRFRNPLCK